MINFLNIPNPSSDQLAQEILEQALKRAPQAEVSLIRSQEKKIRLRQGISELVESSTNRLCKIRLFSGKRAVSGTLTCFQDLYTTGQLLDALNGLLYVTHNDPYTGLPEGHYMATEPSSLNIYDPAIAALSLESLQNLALLYAPIHENHKIYSQETNCTSAVQNYTLVNSDGFQSGFCETKLSLSSTVTDKLPEGVKVNGSYTTAIRQLHSLISPENFLKKALDQVARPVQSQPPTKEYRKIPVLLSPSAAEEFLTLLFSVTTGTMAYRGCTFLAGKPGRIVANREVTIIDDPGLFAGFGSRPFDGEGVKNGKRAIIREGLFTGWLTTTYSARRLNAPVTGNAGAIASAIPTEGYSNLYMKRGFCNPEALLNSIAEGVYVQGLMGAGFNPGTGDFSKGAFGFWIKGGKLTYPVSELTLFGNLGDVLMNIIGVGNDLVFDGPVCAPHVLVRSLTVVGG